MQIASFDTLAFAKNLETAGMPRPQAEVIASVQLQSHASMLEMLATKKDIEEMQAATKKDIENLQAATKRDIENLQAATKKDIESLRTETKKDIEILRMELKKDIESIKADMLKWLVPLMLGQTGLTVALLKLI